MTKARRIAIHYGGVEYAISDRELQSVVDEVANGMNGDEVRWLDVAIGQGRSTPARLLLGTGIPIAIWQVNTEGTESVDSQSDTSTQIDAIAVD